MLKTDDQPTPINMSARFFAALRMAILRPYTREGLNLCPVPCTLYPFTLLFALAVLLVAQPAHAAPRFEGLVMFKTAPDTQWDIGREKVWSHVAYAYASASTTWGFDYAAFASGAFEYRLEQGEQADGEFTPELRELYGKARIGKVDLFAGQQIVSWAQTDMISVLDQLNPIDYRRVLDQEVSLSRLGAPMIRPVLYLGPVQLEAVYMPLFIPPRYDIVGGDWALGGVQFPLGLVTDALRDSKDWRRFEQSLSLWAPEWEGEIRDMLSDPDYWESRTETPDFDLTAPEAAARVRYTSAVIDVTGAFFYLWDDIPTLHLNPALRELGEVGLGGEQGIAAIAQIDQNMVFSLLDTLTLTHHRTPSAGGGFATSVADIAFRAEALYEWDRYTYRDDLTTYRADNLRWVANVEYTFAEDIFVEGLLMQGYRVGDEPDALFRAWQHMVGVVLRKPFLDEKLTFQGLLLWDLTYLNGGNWKSGNIFAGGWTIDPLLTWSLTDRLKLAGGANLFGGEDATTLGYLQPRSRVSASVRYGF
jgi:hypothetical protein